MARLPHPSRRPLLLLLFLGLMSAGLWLGTSLSPWLQFAFSSAEAPGEPAALSEATVDAKADQAAPPPTVAVAPAAQDKSLSKQGEETRAARRNAGRDLRAGRPFAMSERGQTGRFRLALDEIYDGTAPVHERLKKIPQQADATGLINFAQAEASRLGKWPGLVIYPEEGPADAGHRRVLTDQVLLKASDQAAAEKLATAQGLKITGRPAYSPHHLVTVAADPVAAVDAIAALDPGPAVQNAEPLLMRQRVSRVLLDDPNLPQQWHLKNTGQAGGKAGVDIGIESVWDQYQGQNIRIAIVDDGLQLTHPDLSPNVDTAPNHFDWNQDDLDPNPDTQVDFHGTAVGGVAAARGNNGLGVSGVAPQATLVGFRLIAGLVTDVTEAESATRGADVIQIKNNSWGMSSAPYDLVPSGDLMAEAMATAATTGRGGLGTVSVWASGNGRKYGMQGNKDPYSNNMYTIAVGAMTNKGNLAVYSETGSHLCVVAPSAETKGGIVTTDLVGVAGYNKGSIKNLSEVDYTNDFNGTSAATPVVSGIAALMLQANPGLSWRDVKEILMRSATKVFPADKGWVEHANRDPWENAFAPLKHHHSYGGGMVNAASAVAMAKQWTRLGPMKTLRQTKLPEIDTEGRRITPLGGTTIILPPLPEETKPKIKATRLNVDFSGSEPLRVENVTVQVNAAHTRRGDLTLQLVSPSGTISTLASYSRYDTGAHYSEWTFSSVRHWGESSRGVWSVVASEPIDDVDGELGAVTITLHGTSYPGIELTLTPHSQIVPEGSDTAFIGGSTTYGKTERQWLKDGKVIPGTSDSTLRFPQTRLTHAGVYAYNAQNLTTNILVPVALGVVRQAIPAQLLLPGKTATFKVVAAGPALRYQWFVGSIPLFDGSRITGSRGPTLQVRRVSITDAEDYYCRVSMGDYSLNTLRSRLGIIIPPTLNAFVPPPPSVVSAYLDLPILADHDATGYRVTGLPPGVKLDAKTGRLIGRPTKPGTYRITLTASNAAGPGASLSFDWIVSDLPAGLVGTYRGLVEPNLLYNSGYGGSLAVTIGKTGTFSGVLTRGKLRTALKGTLDTYPGETFATVNLSLPRPAPAPPLEFTFTVDNGRLDGSLGHLDEEYTSLWAQREWTTLPAELASLPGTYNLPLITEQTSLTYPLGSGYLAVTLTNRGRLSYTGRLADGTGLTGSGTSTGAGLLPVHHLLYANTGSVQGTVALVEGMPRFEALLDWIKSPAPGTRNYGNGFPRHSLSGQGTRYTPPVAGNLVLELPLTALNAQLDFSKGGLFTSFTQYFTLAAGHLAQFPAGDFNPHQIKMTLNARTGLITGSGTKIDIDPLNPGLNRQRPGSFSGLIIPYLGGGEGYFLLPGSITPSSPIYSGRLIMRAATN